MGLSFIQPLSMLMDLCLYPKNSYIKCLPSIEFEKCILRVTITDSKVNVSGMQKLNFWDVPKISKGLES